MLEDVMGRTHVLVVALPAQGHINPLLSLSAQLALRGRFIVTFVNTERVQKRMLESLQSSADTTLEGPDVRFVTIPDGSKLPLPGESAGPFQFGSVRAILDGLAAQHGHVEDLIVRSRGTPDPITCIIADSFLPWTRSIAKKLSIKHVLFWASNAATLGAAAELRSGRLKLEEEVEVTAGLPVPSSQFLATLPVQDAERLTPVKERLADMQDTVLVLLNTMWELEAPSVEAATAALGCTADSIRCVGPLLPGQLKGSLLREEEAKCMEWLEAQAAGSVLYVAFGSVVSLSAEQLQELAVGIELSTRPFLWVARDNVDLFPEGFLERTSSSGQGLVVSWAPQAQVLAHHAVGGFLSHCGWNSTMESLNAGVPMLCYPHFGDQFLNALLLSKVWKLGMNLVNISRSAANTPNQQQKKKEEEAEDVRGISRSEINTAIALEDVTVTSRSEINTAIALFMGSEELRQNAATWKATAHEALAEGGSSYLALEATVRDLSST